MEDLREFLKQFGDVLVSKYGFEESPPVGESVRKAIATENGTDFVTALGVWIDQHPRAQDALREMGLRWSKEWRA